MIAGLLVGAAADGLLRLITGEEGNLLVHSVLFLICGLLAAGVTCGLLTLPGKFKKK